MRPYASDAGVCRALLWHTWASDRINCFLQTYKGVDAPPGPRRQQAVNSACLWPLSGCGISALAICRPLRGLVAQCARTRPMRVFAVRSFGTRGHQTASIAFCRSTPLLPPPNVQAVRQNQVGSGAQDQFGAAKPWFCRALLWHTWASDRINCFLQTYKGADPRPPKRLRCTSAESN
jgi:hypothetical protein